MCDLRQRHDIWESSLCCEGDRAKKKKKVFMHPKLLAEPSLYSDAGVFEALLEGFIH